MAGAHPLGRQRHVRPPQQRRLLPTLRHRDQRLDQHGYQPRPLTTPSLGIVAESGCRYFSELHFPQQLVVGLAVTRLGRSSVTYRLGVFTAGTDRAQPITALGHWVHVYVDRTSRKPVPIPEAIRSLLATACVKLA
ncbi:thioesterase superfamily protein [Mycobacterium kansasii 824]|uniref:Thioesterase superfamily protein n=1 Tax=Mycobacterium kansasii TaxID=1768 RepID=A0A1V3WXB7_MYCKA|nr:thioesterase superfamily protein [Mycobacterium kansasii 824]OOK71408.1 thioesterase superfamily protein [Mycobacterium kansasii]